MRPPKLLVGIIGALALILAVPVFGAAPVFTVPQGGTGSSTLTGILKGNGTSGIRSAVPGTDYQAPVSLTTSGSSGAATFTNNTLNIPQYQAAGTYATFTYPFPSNATTTNITFSNGLTGNLTGNADTATALAANGTNCSAGNYPLGVDASGNAESCTTAASVNAFEIATSSSLSISQLAYFTKTSGRTTLGGVATSSASCSSGASCSAFTVVGSVSPTITVSGLTTSNFSSANISQWTNNSNYITLASLSASAPIRYNSSTGAFDFTGLATTSQPSSSNLLVSNGGAGVYGVATGTLSASSPLSVTAGRSVIGGSATIALDTSGTWSGNAGTASALAANGTNCSAGNFPLGVDASGNSESCTAALTLSNLSASYPLSYNSGTGAFTFNGLSTTTTWTAGQLAMVVNGNTVSSVATSSATINSPLSGALTVIGSGNSLSIANAAADGSTKGAASFTAADFDASSGNISLDYTNGQKATGSVPGFLSATDWTVFNNKISSTSLDTSAELASLITDEVGSGSLIFGTAATLSSTTLSGATLLANATTTNFAINNGFTFGGVTGTAWSAFCTAITGGSGLCDGVDNTSSGSGSGNVATSTNEVANQLAVFSSNSATPATIAGYSALTFDNTAKVLSVGSGGTGSSTVSLGPDTSNQWLVGYFGSDKSFRISSSTYFGANDALTIDKNLLTTLSGGLLAQASSTVVGNFTVTGTTKLGTLSGVLKASSGTVSAGADGTDYTLIDANTCTNQLFSAVTAAGEFTCASVTNSMITNSTIDLTTKVKSLLPIANGGTNASTFSAINTPIVFDGTRLVATSTNPFYVTSLVATGTAASILPNASTTALSVKNKSVTGDRYLSSTVASSTWTATSSENRITAPFSGTIVNAICTTNTGTTNVQVKVGSTNVLPMFNASTTAGIVTFTSSNTFVKGNIIEVDFGTPASTPTNAACTVNTTLTGL